MAIVKGQTPIMYTGMESVDDCTKLYIDNCIQIQQLNYVRSMPNSLTSFILSLNVNQGREHTLN